MYSPHQILGHWQLLAFAAAAGLALGVVVLAVIYLAPLVRLRLANDRRARERVLEVELERLRRLEDAAAIHQEHGHPDAGELRADAELRRWILRRVEQRLRGGGA